MKRLIIEGLKGTRISQLEHDMTVDMLFEKISREENIPLQLLRIAAGRKELRPT